MIATNQRSECALTTSSSTDDATTHKPPAPNILSTPYTMITRNAKTKDKDLAGELDEIRQLNKKNHQAQRQQEEEELKRLQDETQNSLPGEGNGDKPMDPAPPSDGTIPDFTSKVHKIMNGLEDMDTSDTGKDGEVDVPSPAKKRHGSSKSSSRRNAGTRQVSPPKVGQAATTRT
jgi:hypothetical protein